MQQQTKSILEMARGAFLERTDYEMKKLIENILDPNTHATAKRKMTITMTFMPDDDRKNIGVKVDVKSTPVSTKPAITNLYVAGESSDGAPHHSRLPDAGTTGNGGCGRCQGDDLKQKAAFGSGLTN